MSKSRLFFYFFFTINCLDYVVGDNDQTNKNVICYIPTWTVYRSGEGKFSVEDVDPDLCTHAIYAYFGLNENTSKIMSRDEWGDFNGLGQFEKFKDLKEKNPNLKLLVAVGGWAEGSAKFSNMAASSAKRSIFIQSVHGFLKEHQMDGVEITWQFPTDRGGIPEDKQNFVSLLKELREKLGSGYLIAVFLNAKRYIIDSGYDIKAILDTVDLMNIYTAEYYGPWEKKTGINSPLTALDELNMEFTIDYFIKKGANPSKMMPAIPTFGHAYNLKKIPDDDNYYRIPSDGGFSSPWTLEDGVIAYFEICNELSKIPGWKEIWHEESKTPFAVNNKKFVSFDNPRSITEKIILINEKNLGGAVVYKLDADDSKGLCGSKYPLLNTISSQLIKDRVRTLYKTSVISHPYG